MLFSIFVIMISGAGATLSEYYGINPYVGRVVMSVLAASTAALGLNKLTKIIGRIGPLIIAFVVVIGLISIFGSDTTFQEATQTAVALDIPGAHLVDFGVSLFGLLYHYRCQLFCRDGHPSQGAYKRPDQRVPRRGLIYRRCHRYQFRDVI